MRYFIVFYHFSGNASNYSPCNGHGQTAFQVENNRFINKKQTVEYIEQNLLKNKRINATVVITNIVEISESDWEDYNQ